MSYQVKVDPSATAELDEAINWDEGQKAGLGVDFLLKFYNAVVCFRYIACKRNQQDDDELK